MFFHQRGEMFIYRQGCEQMKPVPPLWPGSRARSPQLGLSKEASHEPVSSQPVSSEAGLGVLDACGTESAEIDDLDERHLARHPHRSYQAQLPPPYMGSVIRLPAPMRIRR